jgi:hypothetical protein
MRAKESRVKEKPKSDDAKQTWCKAAVNQVQRTSGNCMRATREDAKQTCGRGDDRNGVRGDRDKPMSEWV